MSDVRLISNLCDKHDYPACENTTLSTLVARVGFIGRGLPDVHRRVARRDFDDAFKRVAVRPYCASILCAEFPGDELGLHRDIMFSGLLSPSAGLHRQDTSRRERGC